MHLELVGGILLGAGNISSRKIVLQEFVLIPQESSHFNLRASYQVLVELSVVGFYFLGVHLNGSAVC